jgi:hypothetical protein
LLALALFAILSPSCYRAEIDLGLRANDSPQVGGDAGMAGGAAGQAGAPAEPECDPQPLAAELELCKFHEPTREECTEQDREGFQGCYSGGCWVCTELLSDYPYYFKWNPCCRENTTCNSNLDKVVRCHASCPIPSEHDKVPPCWLADVTP